MVSKTTAHSVFFFYFLELDITKTIDFHVFLCICIATASVEYVKAKHSCGSKPDWLGYVSQPPLPERFVSRYVCVGQGMYHTLGFCGSGDTLLFVPCVLAGQ